MMVNKGLAATAALAAVLAGGLAYAKDAGVKGAGGFAKADKDGDGKVSVAEIDDRRRDFFAKADADKDGFVTKEEMETLRAVKKAEMQAKRFPDANKDGFVDRREHDDAARARFADLDKDADGRISEDEMRAGSGRGQRGHGRGED